MGTIVVVMGVAGSGKTTVGRLLAERLDLPFFDGDDAHTDAAKAQMAQGTPLTEEQRGPWLDRLRELLGDHAATGVVLACSALTVASRRHLSGGLPVTFVALIVPAAVLEARLRARHGHFAGPALLASQLATLELDGTVITVDGTLPVDDSVLAVERALA